MRILDACVALLPSPESRRDRGRRQGRQAGGRLLQREGPRRRAGLQDRLRPVRRAASRTCGCSPGTSSPTATTGTPRRAPRALLGPLPAAGQGARQRARGARRRHRRGREAQGDVHRRHADDQGQPRRAPRADGARGLDRVCHRAEGQGRRGQDLDGPAQADRGGSLAQLPARRGDQGVPPRGRLAAPRRDRGGAAEEALRRRGHPPSAEGSVPRDDHEEGRGPRPTQEADRRPRAVRRLPHPRRAAAARQGLRVRRRHLRRRDPAQLHPRRREGHPGGPAPRASSRGSRWWTSASPSTTASTTTSTPRSSRSSSPARSPTRRRWRRQADAARAGHERRDHRAQRVRRRPDGRPLVAPRPRRRAWTPPTTTPSSRRRSRWRSC